MKPPTHPSPSGDRRVGRLLMRALEGTGCSVELASAFRSFEGGGDGERQARLRRVGHSLARRLMRRYERRPPSELPDLWFTYHLYHKAPDWLGPAISRSLAIPYVVAEASYAPKQTRGPWARNLQDTAVAIGGADAVVSLNPADEACIEGLIRPGCRLARLAPFVETSHAPSPSARSVHRRRLSQELALAVGEPWLVTTAMMRRGDKLASFRVLASALAELADLHWQLIIIGDGVARPEVEAAFSRLPAGRIRFVGFRPLECHPRFYLAADAFVWPAINEAFGMALLEAQAAGLPVVAGDSGGVGQIVRHDVTGLLVPPGDARAFARSLRELLASPARRSAMAHAALASVSANHSLAGASKVLGELLASVIEEYRVKPAERSSG